MAKVYIYSTLTADNSYALWQPPVKGDTVRRMKLDEKGNAIRLNVRGGANVSNKHFVTPKGVLTVADKDLYEAVKNDACFQAHCDGGFIKVEQKEAKTEKVTKDMTKKDKSAPKTKADYKKAPKTNTDEE